MTAARRKIFRVSLVGLWLLAAACAEAGPRLYVSNEFVDTVTVIDLQTEERIATIDVGDRPRGIKASPDRRHVYVALGDDDAIGVIEVASNTVLEKIPAGEDPEVFDISPDGRFLYVSNE
ncbi:MAG: beta-propeller fold lactonase family protein, partial [Gemmatimonadota bacterium]